MKQKIILLFFITTLSFSQYKVQYDYVTESFDSFGATKTISKCYLYTDNTQSKFIKDRVINGVPEQENQFPKKDFYEEYYKKNQNEVQGDSIGYVVTKFFKSDSIHTRSAAGALFKEKSRLKDYTITDEYKTILDYKCQKAITEIFGREFIVWFTADIPVSDGPWKLYGLPGLILEAHSKDNHHNFYVTAIKKIQNTSFIYTPAPYEMQGDIEKNYKLIYEFSERNFKYRKSKNPDGGIKVTINELDFPLIVFE